MDAMEKVSLTNDEGSRVDVCLHGAHIVSFVCRGRELIFVSKDAIFKPPTAIRGGVPVCWPQFSDMGPLGSHGFARNSKFAAEDVSAQRAVLLLRSDASTLDKWSHEFELRVTVELTDNSELHQTVAVVNNSSGVMRFTNALHTYFRVSNIGNVQVKGLESCAYHDNLESRALKDGSPEAITFDKETDRIYANTGDEIKILDSGAGHTISIRKESFADAVVWNPWIEKAKGFKDFADNEYQVMLCIEPANAAMQLRGGAIEVQPSAGWTCKQVIKLDVQS